MPGDQVGFCRIRTLAPGPIGIMSKSGTFSYGRGIAWCGEGSASRYGSVSVADPVRVAVCRSGPFYSADAQTKAVLIIGEIGGTEERNSPQP